MVNIYSSSRNDIQADEISRFISTWKNWEDYLFGDATYELNKQRQINLRKPCRFPVEEGLLKVRETILKTMEEKSSDYNFNDTHEFVTLRDAACARLTLLNGRRRGEPARLLLKDWDEAYNNSWIDEQRVVDLDELDRLYVQQKKITYMTGKGKSLVPVLIPEDTVPALNKLCNNDYRRLVGVSSTKRFLFASIQQSEFHTSGWHAVNGIVSKLQLKSPTLIVATNNCHRISTLFASLNVPKKHRQLFYSHMGHSEKMNQDVYQAPLALQELLKVGKHLINMDAGIYDLLSTKSFIFM